MQTLRERSTGYRRRWTSPWIVVLAVLVLAAGGGVAYALVGASPSTTLECAKGVSCSTRPAGAAATARQSKGARADAAHTFDVASTSPANGAAAVPSNARLTVTFTAPIVSGGQTPTLSPTVTGNWRRSGTKAMVFTPSAPFVPFTKYTLSVPGGRHGVQGVAGAHLAKTDTVTFTIAPGSTLRLQQLLAALGCLPLSTNAPTPPPRDMATAQPGTFTWRWPGLPAELTDQWVPGAANALTKGAVMMFETENSLPVDGVAGPQVWTALLADVSAHKANTEPLSYVLVTKALPQHLTAWVNGTLALRDVLVNTGVPGATTHVGTFQVFEHVPFSDMKGTNVTGTTYTDPHVPWASYFNGGDALHGFPRAHYGFPQSNGCVEMRITTAAKLWPYTPVGTLVTVIGPSQTPPAPPTTTTTTAPPTTTTTSTAPPTTTTTAASG